MVKVKIRTMTMRDGESVTVPRAVGMPRVKFDQFVRLMADGGRMTSAEVVTAFTLLKGMLVEMLMMGQRVETPLGTFSASIRAGERDEFGNFDVKSANARINFRPAKDLLGDIRRSIQFEPDYDFVARAPRVLSMETASEKVNGNPVHPGDFLYVCGTNLEFDPENDAEGVFLIDAQGKETRAAIYGQSGARRASLTVPAVADGAYTVQVRALGEKGAITSGEAEHQLTVAARPAAAAAKA